MRGRLCLVGRSIPGSLLSIAPALLGLLSSASPVPAADVVKYYHLDGLGNVRAVTNQSKAVVERHDYLPFGEECVTGACAGNPAAGAGQARKFTGKERDPETGVDYFGARYYGSKAGRFTTTDPVYTWRENPFDPQRWNRYAYARNNPLRYVDPDGKVIFDYQAFKGYVSEAASFGQEGHGYLVPTVAGLAAAGSVANDVLLAIGVGEAFQAVRAGLSAGAAEAGAAVARGGVQPVLKGAQGVERSVAAAEARGETIIGREITLETPAARTRIDLATKTPEGRLRFIECKNGPCADLTTNQRAAFPEIRSQGGVPRGANAAKAGLKPGERIGPTEVVVERH
jgi:RHS repeat-associated protein